MTPEGKVKAQIKAVLKKHPNVFWDMPVPTGYGKSMLDFVGCSKGRAFMIEAKAKGKKPTALQSRTISEFSVAGGSVFVVAGEDSHVLTSLDNWLGYDPRIS